MATTGRKSAARRVRDLLLAAGLTIATGLLCGLALVVSLMVAAPLGLTRH